LSFFGKVIERVASNRRAELEDYSSILTMR